MVSRDAVDRNSQISGAASRLATFPPESQGLPQLGHGENGLPISLGNEQVAFRGR